MKTELTVPFDPRIKTDKNLDGADAVVFEVNQPNVFVAGKVVDNVYVSDYISQNVTSNLFYSDFGILYRIIGRAIDLKLTKVITSIEPESADNIYYSNLHKLDNGRYLYDIGSRFKEIEDLSLTHNILPMDTYESLPVEHKYGETPEKYGCVVELNIPSIDTELLRQELDKFAGEERPHYVSDRFSHYTIPAPEVINYLRYIGFTTDKYASYPVNVRGTADLDPSVPDYVKFVYSQLESKVFRHNYVVSKNGWETAWHRDHATPIIHGFRLMIPIDPVIMDFEYGRYELTPGKYYFVNNSLLHRGVIPKNLSKRANLMGQLASDIDILKGKIVLKCG